MEEQDSNKNLCGQLLPFGKDSLVLNHRASVKAHCISLVDEGSKYCWVLTLS